MKFGLVFGNTGPFVEPQPAVTLAKAAEAAGMDSLWTVEHVYVPTEYESIYAYAPGGKMAGAPTVPIPDPIVWLTWIAAHTTTIKLATGVMILPQRNPGVFAKEVATLDQLSGGRVELGIGVGWLEEEFDALGVPFAARGARTDEYIAVMRALWAGDDVNFDGEFVSFAGMNSNPKPPSGAVPIHVGGRTKRAARRAGELGDGFFPGTGDIPKLIDMARQFAASAGRDPLAIEMTASHPGLFGDDPIAAIEEAESWGAHRLTIPAFLFAKKLDDLSDALAMYMTRFES